ncbi:BZ3500_MvSof-1268-A1-R1_Chr7-1g09236 [Microbotryum saponariae]|uniref:BZ3500_MvSof-1268-A1-R1_Chr7-1g09236 protein n=1 Tax=Microbotryum saponariae TaxID=289078 RepID=A0A2X0LUU2_9BASI|nr:BZ3501_MvSof-1269-A2-R1_Chr7-1g08941 [Microbotryum saponariae]SDA03053.1 BZ3500_MvSof-1268-A1-R1_Chr7-1g09236 [Microbotryum saponariae]
MSSSVPMRRHDPRRVCLISMPKIALGPRKREYLVYFSGALFALGWWCFLDAAILSSHATPPADSGSYDPVPVHVSFADWTPGICSTLGMIIVNLINKEHLLNDEGEWEGGLLGGGVAWRARLFLFVGFALMAGGLAGSVTVLVIKYVIPPYPGNFGVEWGVANVLQSICIMFSAVVLWTAQNADNDYEYNLQL